MEPPTQCNVYRSAIFDFQWRAVCIQNLVTTEQTQSFTPGFMLVNFEIDVSLIKPAVSQYSDSVPS